jgi:high-affinity iron transporter
MHRVLRQAAIAAAIVLTFATAAPVISAEAPPVTASAADTDTDVRQIWKLLDYIGVDYTGAVANGAVISEAEYTEMKEFAATAHQRLSALPARDGQAALVAQAEQLQAAIAAMAAPADVARQSQGIADALLVAYPVPIAPSTAPDVVRGAVIYAEACASCHGLQGRGDGEQAVDMDPAPIAFSDAERARERSLFSLFEVVSQGLDETAMTSFKDLLSDEDRWAVSFYASTLSATPDVRAAGEAVWANDAAIRARLPNMEALVRTIESGLAAEVGADKARPVLAYLRANPTVLTQSQTRGSDGLSLARSQLNESVKAYQAGDARRAATLALSSYLDGFEPVEAILRTRDADLLARVEAAMIGYRSSINAGAPAADVSAQAQVLNALFNDTDAALSADQSSMTTFLGAFTILLREGVEALLVVVAMITFLAKVERRDVLPYVHAGWALALVAGVGTWAVATYAVTISGANRELTEGFSSLFAAVVLLGVGIWMHGKSLAGRWQTYIKEKLSVALTKKSAFLLFLLAFVAVYREVFETILFYIALAARGEAGAIVAGFVAGVVVLVAITIVMLRTSKRLPISQFFGWSSVLIAVLAFVMVGKGIAALQEAGVVPAILVNGAPRLEAFGVYPSAYPLIAQGVVVLIIIAGFLWNRRGIPAQVS